MGTGSLSRPGHGVDHPPLSIARVKERVELCLYSPSRPSWPVLGRTLPLLVPDIIDNVFHQLNALVIKTLKYSKTV
jgi:hypothetical protein